jgi:hypothetical protein
VYAHYRINKKKSVEDASNQNRFLLNFNHKKKAQGGEWIRIDEAVGCSVEPVGYSVEPVVEVASGLCRLLEGDCIRHLGVGETTYSAWADLGQEEDIHGPGLEVLGTGRVLLEVAQGPGHGERPVHHGLGSILEEDLDLGLVLDSAFEAGPLPVASLVALLEA